MQENYSKSVSAHKIKVLFLIHDLGQGGAEKVLVNLVNHMDFSKFDVTVLSMFDCGENRQFLSEKVHYKFWRKKMIRGNSHLIKLLSPEKLHAILIREHYDIEVAYLEGPCARVISGCSDPNVKLVSWIHSVLSGAKQASVSFRSVREAKACYGRFHKIISVSKSVETTFRDALQVEAPYQVLYNTNDTDAIREKTRENITDVDFDSKQVKLVSVGKLQNNKGFDRILRVAKKLVDDGFPVHVYILGEGPERDSLMHYAAENKLEKNVTLLGYQLNPYKYVSKCDLFVCASFAEGFSTAATEALIVGTPVCTVEVSGMKEMLGEHNEWGVVTENNEEALYQGIKELLEHPDKLVHYKQQAIERGKSFRTEETVRAVEDMLMGL